MLLADVALPIPLGRALTYAVPAAHAARVVPGARVLVPLGTRRVVGVVLEKRDGEPPEKVRDLLRAPDEAPAVPEELLELLRELSSYYLAPIGDVLRLALPPLERELAKEMAQPTLFDAARGVGAREVQWVEAGEGSTPEKTSASASALLARVRASGSVPLAKLATQWPSARGIVKRLAEAGAVRVTLRAAPERSYFRDEAERDAPPELTEPQKMRSTRSRAPRTRSRRRRFSSTASPARARPRSICTRSRTRASRGAASSCSSPRSR